MSENRTCPRCGAHLSAGTPPTQCPRCLLRIGFDTDFVLTGAARRPKEPPPAPEELAGDFPQLEILELIGRGGMGAVYKARQRSLGRVVALKILAVDLASDPAFGERFAREARALAALDHPSIVRVHDFGRAGERFFLLMEYVDGTDLRRMERVGRVAPREALAIVAQVCDALQYAHDHGVVHRDIKPENILVDRRGRVRIADFGLAKLVGEAGDAFALTGTHQAMGTPHYMAPEQIERPHEVDHRADLYSLGVVLYELLTGELPLGRFVPPSSRVQVDVRLDEVVLKALEKDPPRRYQHASEIKTRVEEVARAGEEGERARAARHAPGARKRWVSWVLGATVVLCLAEAVVLAGPFWVEPLQQHRPLAMHEFALPLLVLLVAGTAGVALRWRLAHPAQASAPGAREHVHGHGAAPRPDAGAPSSRSPVHWLGALAFLCALVGALLSVFGREEARGGVEGLRSVALLAGPWFLLALVAATLALVGALRRPSGGARSPWPWVLGCLALALGLPFAGGAFLLLLGTGEGQESAQARAPLAPPSAVAGASAVAAPPLVHTAFCRELEDARAIRARVHRMSALVRLAERAELAPHEQMHLAEALLEGGFFDENADGLVALIEHSQLDPAVGQRIRDEVGGEAPGASKERVLEALARERSGQRR